MALSIQIRGAGTAYTSVAAAKTADDLAKAANPSSAGGWTVTAATKDDLTSGVLTDLATNRSSIGSIAVNGANKLVLTGDQVKAYKDVVLKLSDASLVVTDTGAELGSENYSSLDAVYTKIFSINVTGNANVPIEYRDYQASSHEQALETLIDAGSTGGMAIANFSGNSTALTALLGDADVKTITMKDGIANLTANKAAILLAGNASQIATGSVKVYDTLANINTDAAKTLITDLGTKVSAVVIKISAADITAANVLTTKAAFDALPDAIKAKSSIEITGSAAYIVKNAADITSLGDRVSSIEGTGASIANLSALSSLRSKFTSISITDTAANIAKNTALADAVTSWTSAKISGIKISAVPSSADLTKIRTAAGSIAISVSDTSANINKDLALTNSVIGANSSNLASIDVKDGTVLKKAVMKMSNDQYNSLKDKLTGQNTFNLSAVAYIDSAALDSNASVVNYSVKDAYSSISANLSTLLARSKVLSVAVANATVANMTTINTAYAALSAADKLKFKSVSVTDTSANLLSTTANIVNLKTLSANKLVTSINATDAAIDKITSLTAVSKVADIKVLDTDENFRLASNAKLIADKKVTGFSLTGVVKARLTGGTNLLPDYLGNSKITSISVSDDATNIKGSSNRTIMNNAKISSITANSTLIADIAELSATTGNDAYLNPVSINVSDSWANIKTWVTAQATDNAKVKSLNIVRP
ncbi:hypothetical protein FD967_02455 [Polynucleobacter sp. JS-Mosq-20-D10]|uniref:hypothetical protein n=1 Tax=Polynucleobacter sp. JS-Mosq-20-D10 TaxID=2576922 RepID=UPI001BFD1D7F|nr:hypothetical protein [Polynucleobacter sp. JS-Mosq-20-D10]QWE00929.1 hypothetical protein FD967_02455 [Polynucleobacter sp. JS-Mosq-20-D10]